MSLASMITQALPDLVLDMPSEKDKWDDFLAALTTLQSEIPKFPKLNSRKEKQFWTVRNVPTEYFNILAQKSRLEKYAYVAPFSGTVTEIFSEPGSIVNPGVQIAKIARTGEFELKVPVSLEDLEKYKEQKTARFTDPEGELMARGSILRISEVVNQRTQSADVYYSVKAEEGKRIYNGLYLNVEIDYVSDELRVALPRPAVNDGKVLVLKENKLSYVDVKTKSRKPDTVYVTGLQDGMEVVMEQVGAPGEDIIYKSVERNSEK
jgi:multidrug efflux pump subunit AcrA (membrane-fusion protein)